MKQENFNSEPTDALVLANYINDQRLIDYVTEIRRSVVTPYDEDLVTRPYQGVLRENKIFVVDMDHKEETLATPKIDYSQFENVIPFPGMDSSARLSESISDWFDQALLGAFIEFCPSGSHYYRHRLTGEMLGELEQIRTEPDCQGYAPTDYVEVTIACQKPLQFHRAILLKSDLGVLN